MGRDSGDRADAGPNGRVARRAQRARCQSGLRRGAQIASRRASGWDRRFYSVEYSGFVDLAARSPSERPDALFVGDSALFNARRVQLAHWATHHRVPATYPGPQYVEAGGLMSYGASLTDASRQMGV